MIDHVSDLQWDRLLADELPTHASEAAHAHVNQCAACLSRLRELTAERDAFRLLPIPAYARTQEQEPLPRRRARIYPTKLSMAHLRRARSREVRTRLRELIMKAASTRNNVLLLGKTRALNLIVAKLIHEWSPAQGPFVHLHCAELSTALLESEPFGYEREAQTRPGLLETAVGGTVFLDEVGEIPMEVQAKLLLATEQRIVAIGNTPIAVRFICATGRDLQAEIRLRRFGADFYRRVSQLSIHIPTPRELDGDELDGDELDAKALQAEFKRKGA